MQTEKRITDLLPKPAKNSEHFKKVLDDEIELTDEEIQSAIRKLKSQKAAEINTKRYWDAVKKPLEYPKVSAMDLGKIVMKFAKSLIPGFLLDDQNKEIFKLLCYYFTQDSEFEKAGYSLKKGILLFGNIGCGKTTLMRLFSHNVTNDFVVRSCREVADEYTKTKEGGPLALDYFSKLFEVYPHEHYGQKYIGCCFDDLGTEKTKKFFGNEINVMEDILQNRYDKHLIGKTHLTTNLSGEEIEEIYGRRVRSRLREMCNIIAFDEQAFDRRK